MRLPYPNATSQALIDFAIYTSVHLEAKKETKSLSTPIRKAIDTLNKCNAVSNEKAVIATGSHALLDVKIKDLNRGIQSLSLDILSQTNNNRTDKRYKNIFLDTPSSIIGLPLKSRFDYMKLLDERLKSNPKDTVYKRHLTPLKLATSSAEQVQNDHNKNLTAEQNAIDKENIEKVELRNSLTKVYGQLITLFNKNEADLYFRKAIDKKKDTPPPAAN